MSLLKTAGLVVGLGMISTLVGCGPNDGLVEVSGTVTLDGKPVETGAVSMQPVDGKGVSGGGAIKGGKYSARTSPGNLAVQINSMVEVRKENPTKEEVERGLDVDRKESIPAEYNRNSKLRIEVTPEKRNVNFVLTSDGKAAGVQ